MEEQTAQTNNPVPLEAPARNLTPLLIVVGVIIIVIVLLLGITLAAILFSAKKPAPVSTPEPTPVAAPRATISPPSRYATDSALLQVKSNLQSLQTLLTSADFLEPQIMPPTIETQIKVEPQ